MEKINKLYLTGFLAILVLPLFTIPPWFFPADFGKTIIFRSISTILLLAFAFQFFNKNPKIDLSSLKKNPITWTLGALFGTYLLASLLSPDPYFSFWSWPIRSGGFINFAFYIFFAAFTFLLLKKEDWYRVWNLSIITGALVCLVAIAQYFSLLPGILMEVTGRPASTMGNPILLAIYLLLLFFITLSYLLQEKTPWKKGYYASVLILFSYVILLTQSRAAYIGLLVAGIYFLLTYPQKIRFIKGIVLAGVLIVIGSIAYININHEYPPVLQNNRLFTSIQPRLMVKNLLEDTRFTALTIEFEAIKARPILGYGPENFSVGFDKYYNAPTPLLGIVGWWDRAHNIIMQTLADAGGLGLGAYLALFGILLWQLYKTKKRNPKNALSAHAAAATLIGYGASLLFSFDSFGTYLIFFLLIGYSMHLTTNTPEMVTRSEFSQKKNWLKNGIMITLLGIGIVFVWQYNFKPLYINARINQAESLINQRNCGQGLTAMEKTLLQHSFLDSYARLKYVGFTKLCANWYPQNKLGYLKNGLTLISQAAKLQPNYTRYWIFLGSTSNDLAIEEKDEAAKTALINQAYQYLAKAAQLAPKHQEILIEQARLAITAQDYPLSASYAQTCIDLNKNNGECYFYLALSQIYTKNGEAKKNLELANQTFATNSKASLEQLGNAYGTIGDYPNLVTTYEKLTDTDPKIAQYHSSLAFFYREVGRYADARRQAMVVLELSPESKPNVEAFLKTLP